MIATELNYPVPTIIQKISDADAKILVADGNLHRPHISAYDLSRSLRMKMEGMKQKSGRRKKGTFKAEELDSDVKLAQEMGIIVMERPFVKQKGAYKVIERNRFIFIKEDLHPVMHDIVLLHEIGHDTLHRDEAVSTGGFQEFQYLRYGEPAHGV